MRLCLEVPTDAPQRARAEVPLNRGECDECLVVLAEEGTQQPGLCVQCQAPQKATCHFLLGQTCPVGPADNLFFLSRAYSAKLLPLLVIQSHHLPVLSARERFLKGSVCVRIPIYQSVHTLIGTVPVHTVQWGVILFMLAHSTPGLNLNLSSGYRLKSIL